MLSLEGASKGVIVTWGIEELSSLFGEGSELSEAVETMEILDFLVTKLGSLP